MDATYVVAKAFRTPLHRFVAGTEIRAADIDGAVSVEDWLKLGRLVAKATPAATPVVSPEADPPTPPKR